MLHRLHYPYSKERREFGRQCLFSDRNEPLVQIYPNRSLFRNYILRHPVNRGTQLSSIRALSECNTEILQRTTRGILHVEGGWPKDVNYLDEEATLRHRKKVERDEIWGRQVIELTKPTISAVHQNSAINIYENYFEDTPSVSLVDEFSAAVMKVFPDKDGTNRSVFCIDWAPMSAGNQFVVTLAPLKTRHMIQENIYNCYTWTAENDINPVDILSPPDIAYVIKWCPKDSRLLAGGMKNGLVAVWDVRAGGTPVAVSLLESSHREEVSSLCWVQSKSNSEFYSGSTDGSVLFWDFRKIESPFSSFLLHPVYKEEQKRTKAHACTCLEFEYTIPVRFMAGSDLGYLFLGNRKGMTPQEIMTAFFPVLGGPVESIARNPFFLKNFIVAGDWCVTMWCEECKDSSIIRIKNLDSEVTAATWSEGRSSLYFVGKANGVLEFWDLLLDSWKPIYSMSLFNSAITSLASGKTGDFIIAGSKEGLVKLVKVSEALSYNTTKDRLLVGAMFDRETRKGKLLEGAIREIKLKLALTDEVKHERLSEEEVDEENDLNTIRKGPSAVVIPEQQQQAVSTSPDIMVFGDDDENEDEEDEEMENIRHEYLEIVAEEMDVRLSKAINLHDCRTAYDEYFENFLLNPQPYLDEEEDEFAD